MNLYTFLGWEETLEAELEAWRHGTGEVLLESTIRVQHLSAVVVSTERHNPGDTKHFIYLQT